MLKLLQITTAFCTPGDAVGNIAFSVLLTTGGASFEERIATDLTNLPMKEKSAWTTMGIMIGSGTMSLFADLALTMTKRMTYLAAIARLAGPSIGSQPILDYLREILGASLETRQFSTLRHKRIVLRLVQIGRSLLKAS